MIVRVERVLQRALWWTADYAWAISAWAATVGAPDHPRGYATGERRPVLVIPGVYESWQFMRPTVEAFHNAGHPVHVVPALGTNRRPLDAAAAIVREYLRDNDLHDVVLVGHSKGGLIGKLALLRDDEDRIAHLVTICTPFHGSSRGRLLPLPAVRRLDPDDALVRSLDANRSRNAQITSFAPVYDEHVPEGSRLDGARNLSLPIAGHFRPIGHPGCLRALIEAVAALDGAGSDQSSVTA
jgi:pimeloyl-ACP methyl ester carboxylesterase